MHDEPTGASSRLQPAPAAPEREVGHTLDRSPAQTQSHLRPINQLTCFYLCQSCQLKIITQKIQYHKEHITEHNLTRGLVSCNSCDYKLWLTLKHHVTIREPTPSCLITLKVLWGTVWVLHCVPQSQMYHCQHWKILNAAQCALTATGKKIMDDDDNISLCPASLCF